MSTGEIKIERLHSNQIKASNTAYPTEFWTRSTDTWRDLKDYAETVLAVNAWLDDEERKREADAREKEISLITSTIQSTQAASALPGDIARVFAKQMYDRDIRINQDGE